MTRNHKPQNLKKLSQITTTNGFKIDLANYLYNPSYNHDYPSLIKVTAETETEKQYTRVYYFKHYNGNGEYILETYTHKKTNDTNPWRISKKQQEIKLEDNNRFNLKHLIELAEQITEQSITAA